VLQVVSRRWTNSTKHSTKHNNIEIFGKQSSQRAQSIIKSCYDTAPSTLIHHVSVYNARNIAQRASHGLHATCTAWERARSDPVQRFDPTGPVQYIPSNRVCAVENREANQLRLGHRESTNAWCRIARVCVGGSQDETGLGRRGGHGQFGGGV
jgi:hypothetical protein